MTHTPVSHSLLVIACMSLVAEAAPQDKTSMESVNAHGVLADSYSVEADLSDDGRFIVFQSYAGNLHPGPLTEKPQVYLRDRLLKTTQLVSLTPAGQPPNGVSGTPCISSDGSVILYSSIASDIVPGDTNGVQDVFAFDVASGTTTRVSVDSQGAQSAHVSSPGSVSGDGRWVCFDGLGDDLVPGDTNGARDVFLHDRSSGATTRVSVSSAGVQGNTDCYESEISDDGRWIVFHSVADVLVPGDTNGQTDAFLHDRVTGTTTRVSVDPSGAQSSSSSSHPTVSGDGTFVAFRCVGDDLVAGDSNGETDIVRKNVLTGEAALSSLASSGAQGDNSSLEPSISADGSRVAFLSWANNFAAGTEGHSDVFVHDHQTGETQLVSISTSGVPGNSESREVRISADGHLAVFESASSNLAPEGTNNSFEVYLRELAGCAAWNYCTSVPNSSGEEAIISWSGSTSLAANQFTLTVVGCPPGQLGIFFLGSFQTQSPFGEGYLCITGNQHRLPVVSIDGSGAGSYTLDFTDPTSPLSALLPGDTRCFQFWYRDPLGGGSSFNLSDGLRALFCP